jgi:hypothetical protein
MFNKNGFICKIDRDSNESLELWYNRGWFVVSQQSKNIDEYNEAIKFSRIWINITKYGCKYDDSIVNRLDELLNNVWFTKTN